MSDESSFLHFWFKLSFQRRALNVLHEAWRTVPEANMVMPNTDFQTQDLCALLYIKKEKIWILKL